jgi:glycosyltransferase involved in cell wall biosynthesis
MKVSIISTGTTPFPQLSNLSIDNYAFNLSKGLAKLGVHVKLYCNNESKSIKVKNLVLRRIFSPNIRYRKFNYFIFNLLSIKKNLLEKSNIIHTNTAGSSIQFSSMFKKVVYTSHSLTTHSPSFGYIKDKLEEVAIKRAKAVVAISTYIKKLMQRWRKENIFYIPNGVDTKLFKPKKNKSFAGQNLLTVGNICEQKGLVYLVKALDILSKKNINFHLIHIGRIPLPHEEHYWYYQKLIRLIRKCNLGSKISFTGVITFNKLINYYQNSDLFILPSLQEGMPLVLLEAMSCGLPCVATKISGTTDIITEDCGILVKPQDHNQLANSIEELLINKQLAKEMSHKARKMILKEFSWDKVAQKILNMYRTVI